MTTVLQLSGGKDSLACLLMMREKLDDIVVMWADSGDAFPETTAQMAVIESICKNFVVVHGDQPSVIKEHGYPVDVLPVSNQAEIQFLVQQNRQKLQGFLNCCSRSFLSAMHKKSIELGATTIVRGQKMCDRLKSPLRNGDVVDGITYWFPLEDWTDDEVIAYVQDSSLFPGHYAFANTSLDCMHCTAYLQDNAWKMDYLRAHYPVQAVEVQRRFGVIAQEIENDMQYLRKAINHG